MPSGRAEQVQDQWKRAFIVGAVASAVVLALASLSLIGHLVPSCSYFAVVTFQTSLGVTIFSFSVFLACVIGSVALACRKNRAFLPGGFQGLKAALKNRAAELNEIERRLSRETLMFHQAHEYHAFHYCLTVITDQVHGTDQAEAWEKVLKSIHNTRHVSYYGSNRDVLLDCSQELARLEGVKINPVIQELKNPSETDKKDLFALCAEAFSRRGGEFDKAYSSTYVDRYLAQRRCFVARADEKIIGMLMAEEKVAEGKHYLFLHTLARRANMAKIGLTTKFKEELEKILDQNKYVAIYCEVLKANRVARGIYERLGFKIVRGAQRRPPAFIMKLGT